MSNELDDVARALFNGQIPTIWRKLAPDTLKSLANWMEHFKRRYEQYTAWIGEGEPAVMWLSGDKLGRISAYVKTLVLINRIPECQITDYF